MISVRFSKVVLAAGLGLFALLSAIGNVLDYQTNWFFLQRVMSIDTVGNDPDLAWRAVTNPVLQRTAFALVILFQALTGLAFLFGAVAMTRSLAASKARFRRAKGFVPVGISLGFLVWFVGFVVVGGEWFHMWRSDGWNGQPAAFFYYATMLIAGIYILMDTDGEMREV